MKKLQTNYCPYCFRGIKPNDRVFGQLHSMTESDPYLNYYYSSCRNLTFTGIGYNVVDPALIKKTGISLTEAKRVTAVRTPYTDLKPGDDPEAAVPMCPFCHNVLLRSFGEVPEKYIAVIGVPASGKTTYLAAANAAMRGKRSLTWESIDSDHNQVMEDITDKYITNDPSARLATHSMQGPFSYRISFDEQVLGDHQQTNIVFFDNPGEFYIDRSRMNSHLEKYLSKADGIVFIINSAEKLSDKNGKVNVNQTTVQDILNAFTEIDGIRNKPTAIVFNQLDKVFGNDPVLMDYLAAPSGEFIDLEAVKAQSESIQELMLNQQGVSPETAANLRRYVENINRVFSKNCAVFATRLLQETEDGTFRFCYEGAETPILWLLAMNDSFPFKKNTGGK